MKKTKKRYKVLLEDKNPRYCGCSETMIPALYYISYITLYSLYSYNK